MVTPVNDFDVRLRAQSPRTLAPRGGIILSTTSDTVKLSGGVPNPSIVTLVATPLSLVGTVTFSTSPTVALTLDATGLIATLSTAAMGTSNVVVTATLVSNGLSYSDSKTISVVSLGTLGYTGATNATANTVTQGLLSARPTGADGDFYFGTDTLIMYQKVSGAWVSASSLGAPAGTNVAGTAAATVVSNAAAGVSANAAVNDATTGLAQRLRSNAANILSASGGVVAGTLTYDGTGTRTGGYGVVLNQKGIAAYNSVGTPTFTVDATTGSAYFAGTLGANTVSASNVVVSSNPDNIVPDPRFKDLAWWGLAGQNVSVTDWIGAGQNTGWRSGSSTYFGVGVYIPFTSAPFPITRGATYRLEIQVNPSADFAGQFSVYFYVPQGAYHSMGQPNLGASPDNGLPIQYDGSSPKTLIFSTANYTIPDIPGNELGRMVICRKITAGTIEIGGISITRVSDSVLIGDGAVQARHIQVNSISVISPNLGLIRDRTSGPRIEISNNLIEGYGAGGVLRWRLST